MHRPEILLPFSGSIYNSQLLDLVTFERDFWQESHAIRDIETRTPEIDDVAAGAHSGSFLDEGRLHAMVGQPVCESGSRDSRT